MDELTEMVTAYVDLKKANKEGSIAIKTLPKEIQPTLKVFDVDGDGTVAPMLDNDSLASYTITGWTRSTTLLTLFSARGDTIEFAASDGKMVVRSSDGTVLAGDNKNTPTGRRLESFAGSLMKSGSFTMMAACGGYK